MRRSNLSIAVIVALLVSLGGCTAKPPRPDLTERQRQVTETERGFAKTMADRDYTAFTAYISEEAVFFSGAEPLRGKEQVTTWWKRFFEKPDAPFSWAPDRVEVLASGTLALSTGPVLDREGKPFARFSSIWRLEEPNAWRIIFDQGWEVCDCSRGQSR
jgi:ketosteroid isomerase-like protein